MVRSVDNKCIQQFLSVDGSMREGGVPPPSISPAREDTFDVSSIKPISRPKNNLMDEALWQAHYLLDQQKRANLQIESARQEVRAAICRDLLPMLQIDAELKNDLRKFEELKAWKTRTQAPNLDDPEQLLMSLLRLFADRENVQLMDWLQIGPEKYQEHLKKIEHAQREHRAELEKLRLAKTALSSGPTPSALALEKAKADIQQLERSCQLSGLKTEILVKKAKIFQTFLTSSRKGQTPIEVIQQVIQQNIAPSLHTAREWTLFGKKCVDLATELTNTANQLSKPMPKSEYTQLVDQVESMMEQIDAELQIELPMIDANCPKANDVLAH